MSNSAPEGPQNRCATIAFIGRPNAGKSTLLNTIVGQHLSIVSAKPQTTRKQVVGIYTNDTTQLIFTDTAGMLTPRYGMQQSMMNSVHESIHGADIVCVVVDVCTAVERTSLADPLLVRALHGVTVPVVLVLNKMDALPVKKEALPLIEEARQSTMFTKAVAISASQNKEVDDLLEVLCGLAPLGPWMYESDQLSTQSQRFFVAELIRESIFELYSDEIPYSTEVAIAEFKERSSRKWYIAADIVVERDTQKAILIGKQGAALKRVGERARPAIEEFLGTGVFIELFVKVRANWRNNANQLSNLGFMLVLASIASCCALAVACSSADSEPQKKNVEAVFNEGKQAFEKENWLDAQAAFDMIKLQFPTSQYADDAQYYLAEINFARGEYILASFNYSMIRRSYPSSQYAKIALFKAAESYGMMSPPSDRDQDYTRKAIQAYNEFQATYPVDSLALVSIKRITDLRTRLAQRAFETAEFYLTTQSRKSALVYFDAVLDEYQDTEYYERAVIGKLQVLIDQKKYDEARTVIDRYRKTNRGGAGQSIVNDLESSIP
jgi:GTPase